MKPAAGPEEPLQGTALGRLEQLCKAAIAGEEGREGNAEHSVRRVGFIANRPGCPPLDSEPAAMPRDRSIGRQVDAGLGSAAVADPDDRVEKADPLDKYQQLLLGLAIDIRPDRHMVGARLENDRGGQRVGAAPPQPHRARIARARGHVLAQRGGQQQRVAIEPGGPAFRLGQRETAGYEIASNKVEFAQHHGIGAAARQHQNGTVVAARDRRSPAPRPIFALRCRERVEVEENFPVRLLAAVAVERSGAPQAARVLRVLPKIEDLGTAPGNYRDVVGPIVDRRERVAIGLETAIAEPRQGRGVLCVYPGERPLAVDLFEPEIGVVVRGFDGRSRIGHRVSRHSFRINTTSENRHFAGRFVRFLTDGSSRDAKSRGH